MSARDWPEEVWDVCADVSDGAAGDGAGVVVFGVEVETPDLSFGLELVGGGVPSGDVAAGFGVDFGFGGVGCVWEGAIFWLDEPLADGLDAV